MPRIKIVVVIGQDDDKSCARGDEPRGMFFDWSVSAVEADAMLSKMWNAFILYLFTIPSRSYCPNGIPTVPEAAYTN